MFSSDSSAWLDSRLKAQMSSRSFAVRVALIFQLPGPLNQIDKFKFFTINLGQKLSYC
jgi:hypothetical protein